MIDYIVLGVVQGITEFLPVSSSGHLVLFQRLFGISGEEVAVSVVLHLGTLVAVCIFFLKDIIRAARDIVMLWYIFVVTAITGIFAIAGKDFFENLFSSLPAVCVAWLCTGILLLVTKRFSARGRDDLGLKDSVILGCAQAIAIIPGVSRSGATIATLLFRGLSAKTAFSFSFIVSIPAVLGATLLEAKKIGFAFRGNAGVFISGFIASLCVGLVSLWFLRRVLIAKRFHWFGYYCIGISAVTLLLLGFHAIR